MKKLAIGLALLAGVALGAFALRHLGRPLAPLWHGSALEGRVLQSGYGRNPALGRWEPEVTLRLVNTDPKKRFHRQLHVDFVDKEGRRLASMRSFVSLPAGAAQHRRFRAPTRLACAGELALCPELAVRVRELEGVASPLARQALQVEALPPEGQAVYAARVIDAATLELTTGQRIRLLGIDAPAKVRKGDGKGPERLYQEAVAHTRKRALEGALSLAFDGTRQGSDGCWQMLVTLEDGVLLNQELLGLGLVRVDERSEFSQKEAFIGSEAAAKTAGRGRWSTHP